MVKISEARQKVSHVSIVICFLRVTGIYFSEKVVC